MGFRYLGVKTKLAPFIISKIESIIGPSGKVSDLMCGTALFSAELRSAGYSVVASDVMSYSYHHARVHLELSKAPKFNEIINQNILKLKINNVDNYESVLIYLNSLNHQGVSFFAQEYSSDGEPENGSKPRKYFTGANANKISIIRETIEQWNLSQLLSEVEYSLLIHDLILAANDIANIAGTYGHYLSKMTTRSKDLIRLKPYVFFENKNTNNHTILQGYAEEITKNLKVDLCYIDPPYIKRQYAANYHILETIARWDKPEPQGVSGLREWRDQYSNFCSKLKIEKSLLEICSQVESKHILVSYSDDGLIPVNDLAEIMRKVGDVTLTKKRYKRFKSRNETAKSHINEYLLHLNK